VAIVTGSRSEPRGGTGREREKEVGAAAEGGNAVLQDANVEGHQQADGIPDNRKVHLDQSANHRLTAPSLLLSLSHT
jgi:hypothetical protein